MKRGGEVVLQNIKVLFFLIYFFEVVLDRSAEARKHGNKWKCTWRRSQPNYGQQKVRSKLKYVFFFWLFSPFVWFGQ